MHENVYTVENQVRYLLCNVNLSYQISFSYANYIILSPELATLCRSKLEVFIEHIPRAEHQARMHAVQLQST